MTFGIMLWSIVLGFALALLLGGRWTALADFPFRGWWLFCIAAALKFVLLAKRTDATVWAQLAVFSIVIVGLAINWQVAGLRLAAAGLLLNLLVVAMNSGQMPLSQAASAAAGQPSSAWATVADGRQPFSSAETSSARLTWLDDRIPFPPTHQVISAGDVLVMIGGVWTFFIAMRARGIPRALRPAPASQPGRSETTP